MDIRDSEVPGNYRKTAGRQSREQKRLCKDGGGEDEEGQRKTVAGQQVCIKFTV